MSRAFICQSYSNRKSIVFFSKHAKRHPNFNANALRQRRLTLSNFVEDGRDSATAAAVVMASSGNVHHVKSNGKVTMTRSASLNKADSVNSSEDTPSEEHQYSDKMSDSLPSP